MADDDDDEGGFPPARMSSVLRTRTRANDLEAAGGRGGRPLRSGAEAGCGLAKGGGGAAKEEEERPAVEVETSFAETAAAVKVAAAVNVEKALLLPSAAAAVAIAAPRSTRVASSRAFLRGGAGAARRPGRASGVTSGREEEEFRPLPSSKRRGRGTAAVAVEEGAIIGCWLWWKLPEAAAAPATAAASAP